jgi:tyrosine-protein kinase Etk/Wzc
MQNSDTDQILTRFNRILRRRKLLLLLSLVAVMVPIGIFNELQTPIYEASTTIVLEEISNPVQSVAYDYSRELRLANRLEEFSRRFPYPEETPIDFDEFDYMVRQIHKSLVAHIVRSSNIMRIAAEMPDPEVCAVVANAAARVFRERNERIKGESTTGVRRFIEEQLAISEEKLMASEEALKTYKETNNVVSFQSEAQEILKRATEAEVLYNSAKTNRRSLEQKLGAVQAEIEKQKRELVSTVTSASSPWAHKLQAQLVELQTRYMELKVQNYPPTHPKMLQLKREIDQTKQDLGAEAAKLAEGKNVVDPIAQMERYFTEAASLEIEIESLRSQEGSLKRVITGYDETLGKLPDKELNLAQLERERNVNQKIYTNLLEKLEETKISEAEKIPDIRIIDEAIIPKSPIRPRKKLNLAIGFLFASIAGLGLAWIQEAMGSPLSSVGALESMVGWPVLASIPRIEKLPRGKLKLENDARNRSQVRRIKRHIYSQIEPYSAPAEAYRMLRTNLQFLGAGEELRTILVTSIGPSEGKSTTLSNLAISLAKLGQKTLVLDTEVRRPVQHTAFDVKRGPGLSEVLVSDSRNGIPGDEDRDLWLAKGSVRKRKKKKSNEDGDAGEESAKPRRLGELLESSVKPVRIKNLQILTSGDAWVNPNVTISNYAPRLKAVLNELQKTYDTILVDAPPLMLVHDAAVVSTLVDGVVFVVNSARVDEESLQKAKQLLDNAKANVLGIVLNHFEPMGVYGSYYSYYKETDAAAASA